MKIITNCEYPHYNEMHPTTLWDNWKNVSMTHCCCPLQRCRRWLQQFLTCQASAYPAISEEEAGESCGGYSQFVIIFISMIGEEGVDLVGAA